MRRVHDWKMELYWRLPVLVQEGVLSAYAVYLDRRYYGPKYKDWFRELNEQSKWSRAATEQWQDQRLQSVLQLAATRVPYYREQWRHLDWRALRSRGDLHHIPLLDKQAIRQNEKKFIADGLNPESLWVQKTSGTTGTSLKIYWPKSMLPQYWAMVELMSRRVA